MSEAKISFQDLMIEVTRQCNLKCAHCLRGDAQDMVIDIADVEALLNQVSSIGRLTFSGGEPLLHPEMIDLVVSCCRAKGISISSFYIATNGTIEATGKLLKTLIDLYVYCEDWEECVIEVSNDQYHEVEPIDERYNALGFFRKKFTKDYAQTSIASMINQGRWHDRQSRTPNEEDIAVESSEESVYVEGTIYLNCNGALVRGCDWSYENQDYYEICKATDDVKAELIQQYGEERDD